MCRLGLEEAKHKLTKADAHQLSNAGAEAREGGD